VKFDFGDDGCVFASGTEATTEDNDADCTISVSKADFISLAEGNLDPMMAFMSGKLKVAGEEYFLKYVRPERVKHWGGLGPHFENGCCISTI